MRKTHLIVMQIFSFQLLELKDIKWHFIGHLQSNKCNNLAGKDVCLIRSDRVHCKVEVKI